MVTHLLTLMDILNALSDLLFIGKQVIKIMLSELILHSADVDIGCGVHLVVVGFVFAALSGLNLGQTFSIN